MYLECWRFHSKLMHFLFDIQLDLFLDNGQTLGDLTNILHRQQLHQHQYHHRVDRCLDEELGDLLLFYLPDYILHQLHPKDYQIEYVLGVDILFY